MTLEYNSPPPPPHRGKNINNSWGVASLIMGVLALVMQQMADLAVGFGLRGVTLQEQLAYFRTLPGYIYIIMLVLFALMPLIVYWRSASTRETPTS